MLNRFIENNPSIATDIGDKLFHASASTQGVKGGDRDEHGCVGSAGYLWCATLNKCIEPGAVDCPSK